MELEDSNPLHDWGGFLCCATKASASVVGVCAIDPDAKAIEVFALTKGADQLHSKAAGKAPAKSKLLAGFKTNFMELTA